MKHRRVFCQGFDGRDVGESDCPSAERPASSDICDMGSCSANTWFFTEWSGQVMNYTFGLYFVFIHYFFVFFFSVRKNAELVSKRARLTVPRTVKLIATLPRSPKHPGRAFRPKIAAANGSQVLGVRYKININNKLCWA